MRRATITKINIAKNEAGLDETVYRKKLVNLTKKNSLRKMTNAELTLVLNDFKDKGFKVKSKGSGYSDKPYVRLIHALWKSVSDKKMVDDGSKKALRAFVKNMTDIADPEFLTYDQASPVIEALKAMEGRAKK